MGQSWCRQSPAHSRCSGKALELRKESPLRSLLSSTEWADPQRAGKCSPSRRHRMRAGGPPGPHPGGSVCVYMRVGVCAYSLRPPARQPGAQHSSHAPLGTPGALCTKSSGQRKPRGSGEPAWPRPALQPQGPSAETLWAPDGKAVPPSWGSSRLCDSFSPCSVSVWFHCCQARAGQHGPQAVLSPPVLCSLCPVGTGPRPACWMWS